MSHKNSYILKLSLANTHKSLCEFQFTRFAIFKWETWVSSVCVMYSNEWKWNNSFEVQNQLIIQTIPISDGSNWILNCWLWFKKFKISENIHQRFTSSITCNCIFFVLHMTVFFCAIVYLNWQAFAFALLLISVIFPSSLFIRFIAEFRLYASFFLH